MPEGETSGGHTGLQAKGCALGATWRAWGGQVALRLWRGAASCPRRAGAQAKGRFQPEPSGCVGW